MHARPKRIDHGLTVARAALLAAAVLLIAFLGYRQVSRLLGETVPAWVPAGNLPAGTVLQAKHLRLAQLRSAEGVVAARGEIEGRKLLVAKADGAPFRGPELAPRPPRPAVAQSIPQGRLLLTVRIGSMDVPTWDLRAGDRLDILQAVASQPVRTVAHDAYVMGAMRSATQDAGGDTGKVMGIDISVPGSKPSGGDGDPALVLAVRPEDALNLTAAEASGPKMKVVLHAASEVQAGTLIDLRPKPTPRLPRREVTTSVQVLTGAKEERLTFR